MLKDYYDQRSAEYEQIYHRTDPIWQKELQEISSAIKQFAKDKQLLEIACGTGYWTTIAAETAKRITAADISEQMLAIAESKNLTNVEFMLADAYSLENVKGCFNAGMANFWFSHVPKLRVNNFLDVFHCRLQLDSAVFMADNLYVHGLGGELITKPNFEDTFKLRELSDGSKHEVLKNYYTKDELNDLFKKFSSDVEISTGSYFWWLSYKIG